MTATEAAKTVRAAQAAAGEDRARAERGTVRDTHPAASRRPRIFAPGHRPGRRRGAGDCTAVGEVADGGHSHETAHDSRAHRRFRSLGSGSPRGCTRRPQRGQIGQAFVVGAPQEAVATAGRWHRRGPRDSPPQLIVREDRSGTNAGGGYARSRWRFSSTSLRSTGGELGTVSRVSGEQDANALTRLSRACTDPATVVTGAGGCSSGEDDEVGALATADGESGCTRTSATQR
jgi:hypothetical protein